MGHPHIDIHQAQGSASLKAVEGMHQLRIKPDRVRVVGVHGGPVAAAVWHCAISGRGPLALEVGRVCQVLLLFSTAKQHHRVVHVPRHLKQAVGALGQ